MVRPDAGVHRARSPDTGPEASRVHVELLRRAGEARRFQLCCSLTETVVALSRRALRDRMPGASEDEVLVRWVQLNYGASLAAGVATRLAEKR